MPITVEPRNREESIEHGRSSSFEELYIIRGTYDAAEALAELLAEAPATFATVNGFLPIDDVTCKHAGGGVWNATVRYGSPSGTSEPQTGDCELSLDMTGGTRHITKSVKDGSGVHRTILYDVYPGSPRTPVSTPPGSFVGALPNPTGTIGVSDDGKVAGVDIEDGAFKFTARVIRTLTRPYVDAVYSLSRPPHVNGSSWTVYDAKRDLRLIFNAGQVKFLGMQSRPRDDGKFECLYAFEAANNVTDDKFEDINGIDYRAWDLIEPVYKSQKDSTQAHMKQVCEGVLVHAVYDDGDFSLLELPA